MNAKKKTYRVVETKQFVRDRKHIKKMGRYDRKKIAQVVAMLAEEKTLPEQHRDHPLHGDWKGFRECHIQGDWLLIYRKFDEVLLLQLMRTGRHTDVFEE